MCVESDGCEIEGCSSSDEVRTLSGSMSPRTEIQPGACKPGQKFRAALLRCRSPAAAAGILTFGNVLNYMDRSTVTETDVQPPVKKSRSYELLPPDMSELKVVLLGSSWSERSSVGNFILGKTGVDKAPNGFERMTGPLKNKTIAIINTPDLPSDISQHQLTEFVTECVRLSDPGPHVFLLVLQPEDFTEEQSLCKVLTTFSDRSFDHSLVLKLTPKKTSGLTGKNKKTLKDMIRKCRYRHLEHQNLEHEELLTQLGQVAKENNGKHVSYEPRHSRYLTRWSSKVQSKMKQTTIIHCKKCQ